MLLKLKNVNVKKCWSKVVLFLEQLQYLFDNRKPENSIIEITIFGDII